MHEINVIGTMNLLAAAGASGSTVRTRRREVVDARLRLAPTRTRRGSARRCRAPRRRRRGSSGRCVEVEGYLRDFAEDNPHVVVTLLRFSNVLGTDIVTPISKALALPAVPVHLRLRPAGAVRGRGRRRPLDRVRAAATQVPGIYNVAGDGRLPWSEVAAHLRQARRAAPAGAHRAWPPRRSSASASSSCRPSCSACSGTDEASTTAGSSGPASSTATRRPARSTASSRPSVCGRRSATAGPRYRYERDVEKFFRHSPAVVRDDRDLSLLSRVEVDRRRRRPHPRRPGAAQRAHPRWSTRSSPPSTASRPTPTSAPSSSPARRPRSARAPTSRTSAESTRQRASGPAVGLRGLPARRPLAAADHRRGQRRRGRRGHEPGARLRRAARRSLGALRHPLPAARAPPRRRPHVDAAPDRRPAEPRRRWCCSARCSTARRPSAGLAWRCVDDDALLERARALAAAAADAPRALVRRTKATIAAMADVDDHEEAVHVELDRPALVAAAARVRGAAGGDARAHQQRAEPRGQSRTGQLRRSRGPVQPLVRSRARHRTRAVTLLDAERRRVRRPAAHEPRADARALSPSARPSSQRSTFR